MTSPKPYIATLRAAVAGEPAPEPIDLVGGFPAATTTLAGGVKKAATVANATDAASVITQLNALLTSLRAAGTIV